jgi:hypothetical protein
MGWSIGQECRVRSGGSEHAAIVEEIDYFTDTVLVRVPDLSGSFRFYGPSGLPAGNDQGGMRLLQP